MAKAKQAKDLLAMSEQELKELLDKTVAEVGHELIALRGNDQRSHSEYKKKRKLIAQIKTIQNQR